MNGRAGFNLGGGKRSLATWDVFHSDRLEVERSLSSAAVRSALERGELHGDDLARPAGTNVPWARLSDMPDLLGSSPSSDDEPAMFDEVATDEVPMMRGVAPEPEPPAPIEDADEDDEPVGGQDLRSFVHDESEAVGETYLGSVLGDADELDELDINLDSGSRVALPVPNVPVPHHERGWDELAVMDIDDDQFDPQEEDEEAAEFTLARSATGKVEELDLAAMVDVAFQMVLFFMVTATTVLFKTLEVPRTPPQDAPAAVAQGQSKKTLDDLQDDFIVVEIDPEGAIKVNHEPATAASLVERLRAARTATGQNSMLLSADMATPHRNAVLAYDAANEIGLKIAIAKPASGAPAAAPPPISTPAPKKGRAG